MILYDFYMILCVFLYDCYMILFDFYMILYEFYLILYCFHMILFGFTWFFERPYWGHYSHAWSTIAIILSYSWTFVKFICIFYHNAFVVMVLIASGSRFFNVDHRNCWFHWNFCMCFEFLTEMLDHHFTTPSTYPKLRWRGVRGGKPFPNRVTNAESRIQGYRIQK